MTESAYSSLEIIIGSGIGVFVALVSRLLIVSETTYDDRLTISANRAVMLVHNPRTSTSYLLFIHFVLLSIK